MLSHAMGKQDVPWMPAGVLWWLMQAKQVKVGAISRRSVPHSPATRPTDRQQTRQRHACTTGRTVGGVAV